MCVWFFGGLGVYFVFFSDNLLNCFLFIDNFDIIIEKKKNQNKLKTNLSGISKKKCSIIFRLKLIQIVWKIDLLSSYRIELTCTKYDIYTILTNLTSESTDTPPPLFYLDKMARTINIPWEYLSGSNHTIPSQADKM